MAKKKGARRETRTEFLRRVLGKSPDLDHQRMNHLWTKAGRSGEISGALYDEVRAEMGIETEGGRVEEAVMQGDRVDSPNDDLVEAAEDVLPHILMSYKRFEGKRPVMLLDLQSRQIYAYPYEEFKADLGQRSQAMLTADREEAVAMHKGVVFVRDDATRRLASMLFDRESTRPPSGSAEGRPDERHDATPPGGPGTPSEIVSRPHA